ncbi:MAG: MBL fold metallo-hydrolase [Gammaproteobacteria bacterium]|nr:MAG: MBL fold metallo-hydrolase [Gammaproteobacteria bacterium]
MFNSNVNKWPRLALAAMLCGAPGLPTAVAGVTESYENRHDPGPPRNLAPPGVQSRLVMLGTGNPVPNPYRFGPGTAVVVNGKSYLFDAGEGVWRGLAKAATFHGGGIAQAFQVDNLTHLFITHMHPDHTIGIPALILQPWYLNRANPMDIYGPPGITRRVGAILDAWRDTIELDLAKDPTTTPHGWKARGHDFAIDTSGVVYQDQNVKVEAFQHKHWELPYNYAYRVTTPDRVLVIGGDGSGDDRLIAAAQGADVFVAEVCTEADLGNAPWGGKTVEEKGQLIWQYHIKPRDLARIAAAAKVKLLVLYHVQNYSDPYDPEAVLKEVREFYDGPVVQARDGDLF